MLLPINRFQVSGLQVKQVVVITDFPDSDSRLDEQYRCQRQDPSWNGQSGGLFLSQAT